MLYLCFFMLLSLIILIYLILYIWEWFCSYFPHYQFNFWNHQFWYLLYSVRIFTLGIFSLSPYLSPPASIHLHISIPLVETPHSLYSLIAELKWHVTNTTPQQGLFGSFLSSQGTPLWGLVHIGWHYACGQTL